MEFIFYFILRRFFVSLQTDSERLILRKGLIFRRIYYVPISSVTVISQKRTPLLRLLRARKVTVRTLSGKISFYLRSYERFEILPKPKARAKLRARFGSSALCAFTHTRALGAAVVFATAISRVGSVLGSGYYDGIIAAIEQTAVGLSDFLDSLRITVPRITTVIAVFTGAAWLFAFINNLLKLSRFRLTLAEGFAKTSHGTFTLYEEVLVTNDLGAVLTRRTASALAFKAAPMYCFGTLLFPALKEKKRRSLLRIFLGTKPPSALEAAPPKRALLGHISCPLWWSAANALLLFLCCITGSDPILRTVLWGGLSLSLWYCILYFLYMRRSGVSKTHSMLIISARKGTALHTLTLTKAAEYRRFDRNIFQMHTGLCDVCIFCRGKLKLKLKNMYYAKLSELL